VALLEKRRFLYNHSGDFPQVILIVPSHVPNTTIPWIFMVRLGGGLSFPPSDHWQRRQIKVQSLILAIILTMDTQGEAAGGLSFLPSDHWQRRSDQGTVNEVQLSMTGSF
jgi:hypothetical protein